MLTEKLTSLLINGAVCKGARAVLGEVSLKIAVCVGCRWLGCCESDCTDYQDLPPSFRGARRPGGDISKLRPKTRPDKGDRAGEHFDL